MTAKPGNVSDDREGSALKDACEYGLDLTKQFLTLSSAGIAFVTGLIVSGNRYVPFWVLALATLLFALSILFGLLILMKVVGNVARSGDYNLYCQPLQAFALAQIVLFLIGIFVVAAFTLSLAKSAENVKSQANERPSVSSTESIR